MNSYFSFLPAGVPVWLFLAVVFVAVVVLWKILRRILSVIWAIRAVIAIVTALGFGGYLKGWSFNGNSTGSTQAAHR